MTAEERFERIESTLDRLTSVFGGFMGDVNDSFRRMNGVVEALAASVAAHDNQIEQLVKVSEQNAREWQELRKDLRMLERQFQAYLNTLPKH